MNIGTCDYESHCIINEWGEYWIDCEGILMWGENNIGTIQKNLNPSLLIKVACMGISLLFFLACHFLI